MRIAWRLADWPLRAKLAALLVAASLLPLSILTYVELRQTEARLLAATKNLLVIRVEQIAHKLDEFHRGYQRSADSIGRLPDSAAFCAAGTARRAQLDAGMMGILSSFPKADAGIRGVALLDGSGRVVVGTEPALIGVDLAYLSSVRTALQGKTNIADLYVSSARSGSVPTIAYLTPMFDANQRVSCVVGLWVRAAGFWDAVKASNALAGPDSFAVLFDQEGIRIAHTYSDDMVFHPGGPLDPATVDRLVAARRFGVPTRALLEEVRASPEQFERARALLPDRSVFRRLAPATQAWAYGVGHRLETVPWTAFYMVPAAVITSQIAQVSRDRMLLAIGVMAAAGIVGLVFAASILRPIRALSRAAAAIAGGDHAARVQNAHGDELGQFGVSFNAMADHIQAQAKGLQRSHDELDARVQERTAELVQTTRKLEAEIAQRGRAESVLRERDAALHRAQVMSKLAHVISRSDGSFENWSDTLPPLIGVAPADMPRSTREWIALVHAEDRPEVRSTSIAAGTSGTRKELEYRLQHADGTWLHLRQVIEPIPEQTGADGGMRWFNTIQDVTERKRAEQDLRESQQLLQAIIDNSAAAIYVKDLEGRYLLINRRYSDVFHISNEAIAGKCDHDLFAKEVADPLRALDQRVAAADAAMIEEEVVPHDDGPHTYVSVKCPLRDRQGRVYGVFGISTDITDRKQAEDALRASEERLQDQLDRLTLLDQITRAIGERQDLQSIYQVAIGSVEERLPVDFACVCHFDAVDNALTIARVGAHSHPLALELALDEQSRIEIDQNGLSRAVHGALVYEPDIQSTPYPFSKRLAQGGLRSLVIAPLQSESRVFGLLVAARRAVGAFSSGDCEFLRQLSAQVALAAQQAELHGALQQAYDDLRQTQQTVMQQERLRALGQMASGIAHDINNALSPVAIYTESLLEREPHLSERGRGYLVTIARAIDDVAATVARMGEFYRQRETQLLPTPVLLNSLVHQVVDLTRARWSDMPQQRGIVIRLDTELAPDLPAILGVESEVREALINLVFNAVDAMPDGGVLTMRTRCAAPHASNTGEAMRHAVVEVSDTGVGMSEDTRRRCLEPFFTTKGERGSGLGLAMVYGVTQRHGAEVDIDSAAERGTTVQLSFPIPAIELPASAAPPPPEAPTSRLRILIVDDDPMMLKSLCDSLGLDGHAVVTANGGQAGIDAFRADRLHNETFDVVITDLGMPNVDGRKVAGAVKAIAGATPVILLTGWGQRLVAAGEVPAHVDRVLSKPPKLRDVRAALAQLTLRAAQTAATGSTKELP